MGWKTSPWRNSTRLQEGEAASPARAVAEPDGELTRAGFSARLREKCPPGAGLPLLGRLLDFYSVAVLAWALAHRLWGDRWGLLGMVNAWGAWLARTGLLATALRLGRRRSSLLSGGFLAVNLSLLAGYSVREVLARWGRPTPVVGPGQPSLRLMTFNLLKHNRDADAITHVVAEVDPDVVAFQEVTPWLAEQLEARLTARYPYRLWHPHSGSGGLALLSRFPLEETGYWTTPGVEPFALRGTATVDGRQLDIYAVHLIAPAGDHLQSTGLTGNFRLREKQAALLSAEVAERALPAIVMGDFNFTETNDAYRLLADTLVDAWKLAGQGYGATWPCTLKPFLPFSLFPLLRLDYCFHTASVVAVEARVWRGATGSDHAPLVVEVLL